MTSASQFKLRSTIKYPTSLIVNGLSNIGLEIADALLAQGGYVILVDMYNDVNLEKLMNKFSQTQLVSFLDYSVIPHLAEDIRRLDYVFYLGHEGGGSSTEVSTQNFLKYSNYLDTTLSLAVKFEAKFLLTTAIKAHHMLLSHMDADLSFGVSADARHAVYTEMEVQRYAEGLCLEYVAKTGLNARIVRLGEIIGEGMDFTSDSAFVRLVLNAVKGQDLELASDGLDSEWFVHLLDATYGVIKAQFSKDTQGGIFSLAYEHSVTHLSIAYKLQELEQGAKEIVFVESADNLPPMRLHKPAPNLSRIGWKARVEFEKALAESVASAKLYLLNAEAAAKPDTGAGVVDKIRSFFAVAEHAPTPAELEMLNSGPVSRLIAERKMQEQARLAATGGTDSRIKSKWKERQRTPGQRLQSWIWDNFLDPRTSFPFLRRMPPGQFILSIILVAIFAGLYFVVISPIAVWARNVVMASSLLPGVEVALAEQDWPQVRQDANTIHLAMRENSEITRRFIPFAQLTVGDGYLGHLGDMFEVYANAMEGVSDLAYAVEPLSTYLGQYQDNTEFRSNAETYLAVSGDGRDYSPILDEMTARRAYADVGSTKLKQASLQMEELDFDVWPEVVTKVFNSYRQRLTDLGSIQNYKEIGVYGSEALGAVTAKTYLALVVDNTRQMPVGGDLSAFVLMSIQNGAVTDTRLQSIDSFKPSLAEIPTFALTEINLNSFEPRSVDKLTVRDLGYIANHDVLAEVAAQIWGKEFNRQVDGVAVVNYNLLADLLDQLGAVQVENVEFTGTDLLTNLASLEAQKDEVLTKRNDTVAQILGMLFERFFDEYRGNLPHLLTTLAKAAAEKDVVISGLDLEFSPLFEQSGVDGGALNKANLPVWVTFVTDPTQAAPQRSALNQSTQVKVNADFSLSYTSTLKFPVISNVQFVNLCSSSAIRELKVAEIPLQRVKLNQGNNRTCVVVNVADETQLQYTWSTVPIESSVDSEYNLVLGQSKTAGVEAIADLEVSLAAGLNFLRINPDLTVTDGRVVFSKTLSSDQLIELVIKK